MSPMPKAGACSMKEIQQVRVPQHIMISTSKILHRITECFHDKGNVQKACSKTKGSSQKSGARSDLPQVPVEEFDLADDTSVLRDREQIPLDQWRLRNDYQRLRDG
jgi:hypothetical protein